MLIGAGGVVCPFFVTPGRRISWWSVRSHYLCRYPPVETGPLLYLAHLNLFSSKASQNFREWLSVEITVLGWERLLFQLKRHSLLYKHVKTSPSFSQKWSKGEISISTKLLKCCSAVKTQYCSSRSPHPGFQVLNLKLKCCYIEKPRKF